MASCLVRMSRALTFRLSTVKTIECTSLPAVSVSAPWLVLVWRGWHHGMDERKGCFPGPVAMKAAGDVWSVTLISNPGKRSSGIGSWPPVVSVKDTAIDIDIVYVMCTVLRHVLVSCIISRDACMLATKRYLWLLWHKLGRRMEAGIKHRRLVFSRPSGSPCTR